MTQAIKLRIDELPPYPLGRIAEEVQALRLRGVDVLDLSQVNIDLAPPQRALDKLVQASLRPQNHRYSSSQGIQKLREAVAEWYQAKFDVAISAAHEVVVTFGIKEGISHLLMTTLQTGDNVIVPTPAYPVHRAGVFLAGGNFIGLDLPIAASGILAGKSAEGDQFFAALEHSILQTWPRPRAMILSFPHNPTTTVVDHEFFERLVDFAVHNNLILIHDFAYAGLGLNYQLPSLLSVPRAKECAIEFCSLSKSYSSPGWRVGFGVGNAQLVSALKRMKSYVDFGIFQPLQIAAIETLADRDQYAKEIQNVYQSRRDLLVSGLSELGFEVTPAHAGLLVWAKIPQKFREQGSAEFARMLLESNAVAICPGLGFDPAARDYARFALVENESRLTRALELIRNFIEK
ncbi:aminotransferase class I/II-fold pyridoxal phosphate-dependent enzyme [bacterium]|nr:aminotransferase class I/II-fold pyridoxal phosphate-dependent enzyme [bacterium]